MLNLGDIGHRVLHIGPKQTGKRRKTRPEKKHAREARARAEKNAISHLCADRSDRVKATGGRNQRHYTRGLFAWRVQNNTASRIVRPELVGPADYVPAGGRSAYDLVPRMRTSRLSEWAIFCQNADNRGRPQLVRAGFKFACEWGVCKKKSCASCWLGEHADELNLQKGMIFLLKEQSTLDQEKIEDAAGVDPAGRKLGRTNACLREDAPHLAITSTIREYKKDNSRYQDPREVKDLPPTKDFRDEIR